MTKQSSQVGPLLIDESNLSVAWSKAVVHVLDNPGPEISPLVLSFNGFDADGAPLEVDAVRQELDALLAKKDRMRSVEDVAFTIFPQRVWKIARGNRAVLFKLYLDAFPRYQAMNPAGNRRGLYFQRLIDYGSGPCGGNQLEWILSQFGQREGVRRSMFQASVFDPARDHVADAQLQFPCMQHVSFEPTAGGLVVNAFYATQQLLVKAYGNYLGIAQLGAFVASQMKMSLLRVNVVVGVAKLDRITKSDPALVPLTKAARACIAEAEKTKAKISEPVETAA